ncbi:MAG: DNA-binding transcriptional LysR family regulator [Kiritimatiellia bacterium]|jgi:DNA-binding transcriptional LysR family regulator
MIPLEALQALDAIDRKGSFAAAAEELFRVPSAITYTIKKLEEQLNIKLFDRNKQRAVLTPTGKLVLEKGRDILLRVQQLEQQAQQAETGWEKQLRVVVDTILPCEPFWPLLSELQEQCPWLTIQLLDEALSGSWEALAHDRADLLIGVSGDEPAGGHFHKELIGHISMTLCCSPSHPASQIIAPVQHQQLVHYRHIVISDSARSLPHRNVGMMGLEQVLAVSHLQQKVSALINGLGISHLPQYVAAPLIEQGRLVAIKTTSSRTAAPFFMVWKKHNTGKANQWLRESIIERGVLSHLVG